MRVSQVGLSPEDVAKVSGGSGESSTSLNQDITWSSVAGGSDSPSKVFKPDLEVVDGVLEVVVPAEFVVKDTPLWGNYFLGHFIDDAILGNILFARSFH